MATKKQWFENWFDTSFYHILYQHRNDDEAHFFMDNLVSHLNVKQNSTVLDLACGKGRHSIFLNKKKLNVTGVDLSEQSILHAKQFENDSLYFDVHDMRKVYPLQFDYVFNLFTSFGYFDNDDENQKTVDAMKEMLKKEGILVIDFLNSVKTIQNLVAKEEKTLDGIHFKIKRNLINNFIVKSINFDYENKAYHFEERVKALKLEDFERFFEKSGLKLKNTFGNFALEDFNEETSERLIMVLEKI